MSVSVAVADRVMAITLNRPDKLNAIDTPMAKALLAALQQADRSSAVRAVMLRGQGRAFCAGRDVSEPPNDEILDLVQQVAAAIVHCSKPVVAGVHGWVVGAGLEWMLDCDLAVAARSARFRLPEVEIGVFVTGGITALLPRIAGLARARGMLLLGEPFDAGQAGQWGLVWTVVDDDQVAGETGRIARRLASFDPAVLGRFKRVLDQVGAEAFDEALRTEARMQTELQRAQNS